MKCGVAKELIFTDKASGASRDRLGLDACFDSLRRGDVLLVWRRDRPGRSVRHLVTLVDQLKALGVGFRSVCDGAIDTTTPSGELIFHIFSALAQFERQLIQERTKAGIAAARARGRKGGRPPMKATEPKVVLAKTLYQDKSQQPSCLRHGSTKGIILDRSYRPARLREIAGFARPNERRLTSSFRKG